MHEFYRTLIFHYYLITTIDSSTVTTSIEDIAVSETQATTTSEDCTINASLLVEVIIKHYPGTTIVIVIRINTDAQHYH